MGSGEDPKVLRQGLSLLTKLKKVSVIGGPSMDPGSARYLNMEHMPRASPVLQWVPHFGLINSSKILLDITISMPAISVICCERYKSTTQPMEG